MTKRDWPDARNTNSGAISTGCAARPNARHWVDVGSINVPMNAALETGLAVTSHAPGVLATAVFESPSVER